MSHDTWHSGKKRSAKCLSPLPSSYQSVRILRTLRDFHNSHTRTDSCLQGATDSCQYGTTGMPITSKPGFKEECTEHPTPIRSWAAEGGFSRTCQFGRSDV
ncbi:unnamed protein product [Durusdinium trenchii]|uniref:Uncharacterized protein n=1 Tax=Durusdinium trenchii TaxID=1381693 RepID=A0ABP0H6B2_9DINO